MAENSGQFSKAIENLESQLAELEMIQSVFPNPGEIKFDDEFTVSKIKKYVSGKTETPPPFVDLTANLSVDSEKFEICITLSHEYPDTEPDIFIRNSGMTRSQHTAINKDCTDFLSTLTRGEPCIFSVISWIQDNGNKYTDCETKVEEVVVEETKKELIRLWIYSHHIYNKTKRREILNLAHDLKLTGFCMPGKPGIICVEGDAKDCHEWWQIIKSMTWKRIYCKLTEECKYPETFCKFKTFQEVTFQNSGARSNHMDMGELHKYLEEHSLGFIFKQLFGVEGKSA